MLRTTRPVAGSLHAQEEHEMPQEITPLAVLTKARELIADPARWTKGTEARNAAGNRVRMESPNAVCFCAVGAINRSRHDLLSGITGYPYSRPTGYYESFSDSIDAVENCIPEDAPVAPAKGRQLRRAAAHNDAYETTHADVLAWFACAIASVVANEIVAEIVAEEASNDAS